MDADQFDALTARLTARLTRRHGLATLGAIGLAGVTLAAEADGKENNRKKRKKRRNKKTTSTSTTAAPTCRDGIRNGSETDIDCGGSCPRCKQGKTCRGVADCESALCSAGTCKTCAAHTDCTATDPNCACDSGTGQCFNNAGFKLVGGPCTNCPAGTAYCFFDDLIAGDSSCYPRCGEVFPN